VAPVGVEVAWCGEDDGGGDSGSAARTARPAADRPGVGPLGAFSARLRQQVDLDTLTAELLTVVDQTMQPTMVSLWLRPTVAASTKAPTGPPP
jgi:hypothetical protein